VDSVTIGFSDNLDLFSYDLSGDPMEAVANFTPTQADVGMITAILEVDDGDGGSDAIVVILNVIDTNDPPGTPTVTQLAFDGLTVPLSATPVDDPDGDDLNYTWDFGDHGEPLSGRDLTEVTHEFPRPGTYRLVLKVTDGNGGESTVEYDVLVPETGEEPPETVVEEGPVWLVVVLIVVFVALTGAIMYLYWKLPKNGNGPQ
jgi:PKD repeat protein